MTARGSSLMPHKRAGDPLRSSFSFGTGSSSKAVVPVTLLRDEVQCKLLCLLLHLLLPMLLPFPWLLVLVKGLHSRS
jgi:hypothetical protein